MNKYKAITRTCMILIVAFVFIGLTWALDVGQAESEVPQSQEDDKLIQIKQHSDNIKILWEQFHRRLSEERPYFSKYQELRLEQLIQVELRQPMTSLRALGWQNIFNNQPKGFTAATQKPEERLSRFIAFLEGAVDYIIMLSMRVQQDEGAKDKDILGQILDVLGDFESSLGNVSGYKFGDMLGERTQEQDNYTGPSSIPGSGSTVPKIDPSGAGIDGPSRAPARHQPPISFPRGR